MRNAHGIFCGVDEAGRGPLAGPVATAAVILAPDTRFDFLNDSKKVTEKRRELLYDEIIREAVAWHVELVDNRMIDEINILQATMYGMTKCIEAVAGQGAVFAVIDGNRTPETEIPCEAVVKGDATSASIAAASILAKVTRDRFMTKLAEEYPGYGFEVHKGYPTKAHYEAIRNLGVTPYHRMTFLKKMH